MEATRPENEINYLKKNKLHVDSLSSEKRYVFTEEVKKMALSAHDDERIQSISSIEANSNGTNEEIILKKEKIKFIKIIKNMKNE